ncbi:MAG TPA: phage holin family protein [Acidimicrobiales bacterium]
MMSTQGWYQPQQSYGPNGSPSATDPVDERPLGELFSDFSGSLQTLLRKEMELAKVEVKDQASKAGKAAGMLAGTAVAGFVALLLLAFAAAWGLAETVPTGVAFLAVGLLFLVIAGLLLVVGKKKLATVRPVPEQTVRTIREDVEVAKTSLTRGVQY